MLCRVPVLFQEKYQITSISRSVESHRDMIEGNGKQKRIAEDGFKRLGQQMAQLAAADDDIQARYCSFQLRLHSPSWVRPLLRPSILLLVSLAPDAGRFLRDTGLGCERQCRPCYRNLNPN